MRSRHRTQRAMLVLACITCTVMLSEFENPASAQFPWIPEPDVRVADVLVFSTSEYTPLASALRTDTESMNVHVITRDMLATMPVDAFNQSLTDADVVYIDRFLPENPEQVRLLVSHVNGTHGYDGLVMFGILQNGTVPGAGDFSAAQVNEIAPILPVNLDTSYVNSTGNVSAPGYVIQVEPAGSVPENSAILVDQIPWRACPLVDRRTRVTTKPAATPVLVANNGTESVLSEWNISDNDSRIMCFSMVITGANFLFTSFPYFAYLVYVCTFHAMYNFSDALIDTFVEWPFSPGSDTGLPWMWLAVVMVLAGIALWLLRETRRKDQKS